MSDMDHSAQIVSPHDPGPQEFTSARAAVDRLCELYDQAVQFLCVGFANAMAGTPPYHRIRAFYPELRITTTSFAKIDSRLSFGHVAAPGTHATTITRPDLFRHYLEQQIDLLLSNHGVPVCVQVSDTPMPVHFAVANDPDDQRPAGRCRRFHPARQVRCAGPEHRQMMTSSTAPMTPGRRWRRSRWPRFRRSGWIIHWRG